MRSIGKRLGAILLCVLMVLTSIGVQPIGVSAEAGSSWSGSTPSGGYTDVTTIIGARLIIVPYNKKNYPTMRGSKAVDVTSLVGTKKDAKMRSDIKRKDIVGFGRNLSNSIYFADTDSLKNTNKFCIGSREKHTSIKVKDWSDAGSIIKEFSSADAGNAFKALDGHTTDSSKWKDAFNTLEKAVYNYNGDIQEKLKGAFGNKDYNASGETKTFSEPRYYIVVEPVCFFIRNNQSLAVSAQDMYEEFAVKASPSSNVNQLYNSAKVGWYAEGESNGVTWRASAVNKLVQLDNLLYQRNFKFTKKAKVNASGAASKMTSYLYYRGSSGSGHMKTTFYKRGGYACIVPSGSGVKDGYTSINNNLKYTGNIGAVTGTISDAKSHTTKLKDDDFKGFRSNDNGDNYLLYCGTQLLYPTSEGKTYSQVKTFGDNLKNSLNNSSVKISWASEGVGTDGLGLRIGTNSNSTIKNINGYDYIVNAYSNADFVYNTSAWDEDDQDEQNVIEGSDYTEDADDAFESYSYDLSDLTQSFTKYGYVGSVGKDFINFGNTSNTKVKTITKKAYDNARDGLTDVFDVEEDDYFNVDGATDSSKVIDAIPVTSSIMLKKKTITSYGYQITYDAENNTLSKSTISGSDCRNTYKTFAETGTGTGNNTSNAGFFRGDKNAFYVVAVPNSSPVNGTAFRDSIYNRLVSNSAEEFLSNMDGVMSDSFALSKEVEGGDEVTVGAMWNTGSPETATDIVGYTVVFIGIKGDIPLTGEEVLESYQLNNIDSDIASNFADQHHNSSLIFKSRKSSTYDYNSYNSTTKCTYCNTSWDTVSSRTKSYDIVYKDASEGEHTVANDNSSLGTYLIRTTKDGGNIANRATLKSKGEIVDTSVETKKFTYAFNLVRALFESKTASSITANNGNKDDVEQVLKMTYGNVPAGITNIDEKRNPNAFVGGTLVESLKWTGTYEDTTEHHASGKYRLAKPKDAFKHTCYTTDANGNQVQHDLNVQFLCKKWSESIKPFKLNKIPMENAKIIVTEKAHKYQTAEMATGKNENQDGIIPSVSSMNGVDVNYDSVLDDDTRYAYLEKHNITGDNIDIYFYPEVKMMMYGMVSGVDEISDDSSVYKKALYTMGEQKRTVQSSSLYLYRISSRKTAEGVGQKLSGKIYSDDMTTNSAGKGDAPVIYAGGNVSLKVDGANMNLNLYGYAVDLVNKSKDGSGFKINGSETLTYKSIVDDESDIYANWGNAPESVAEANRSTQKLFTDYKAWVSNMADSNKYGADVTLQVTDTTKVDGKKEYNNFSTTIGKIVTESGTVVGEASKEEGVYPIAVYNGKVVTSREEQALSKGYWSLVAQVQKDYNCDETTAIKVLEDSGMFDAIYSAIESSTSKFNKSGKADSGISDAVTNEDTALLGSGNNWYDEVVKTFCIRRYVTETLHFDGTVLSDKIDYDAAPKDNSVSSGINDKQSAYNKSNAKWYISFYFKGNPNDGVVGSLTEESKKMYHSVGDYEPKFYNPAETSSSDSFGKAKNTFTVLTEKLHIDGADFIIPSSATSDESN